MQKKLKQIWKDPEKLLRDPQNTFARPLKTTPRSEQTFAPLKLFLTKKFFKTQQMSEQVFARLFAVFKKLLQDPTKL